MNHFLTANTAGYRLARTILQGVIGVAIAYLAEIVNLFELDPVIAGIIVAMVMAILTPIMSCIKTQGKEIVPFDGAMEEQAEQLTEASEEVE